MDNASKYQETKNGLYDFDYGQVRAQIHRNSVNVYHRRHSNQNSDNSINLANNLNINNGNNRSSISSSNISHKQSKSAIVCPDRHNYNNNQNHNENNNNNHSNKSKFQLMNNQSHTSKNLDVYANINNINGNSGPRASVNINLRENTLSHDQSRSNNSLHSMASAMACSDITHAAVGINSVNSSFSHNCSNICNHDNSSAGQRNRIDSVIEHNIVEHIIDDPPMLIPGDSADHYSNLELIDSIIHAIGNDESHGNNNNNNNYKCSRGNSLNNNNNINNNNNNNQINKHLNFNDNASIAESDKSSLQIEGYIKRNVNNINSKMCKSNSRSDSGIGRARTKPKENREKEKEREKDKLDEDYNEYGADIDIDIDNIIQPSPILMVTPSTAQCTPKSNASVVQQDCYITGKNGSGDVKNVDSNNGRNDSIISNIIIQDEMINNNIRLEDVGATFLKIGVSKTISDQNEKFHI